MPATTMDLELANKKVTLIKIDVEGWEKKVLLGAKKIIRAYRPKMAVCIYHRAEDMWDIPMLLLSLCPDYKFYVRHYSLNGSETVLYAV